MRAACGVACFVQSHRRDCLGEPPLSWLEVHKERCEYRRKRHLRHVVWRGVFARARRWKCILHAVVKPDFGI